jgi:hypothetical protein
VKNQGSAGRLGAGDRCPLCAATSGVTRTSDGYQCLVCGAPRVLVTAALPRSGAEKPFLERAKSLGLRRAAWGVAAGIAAAVGAAGVVLGGILALLLGFHGTTGAVLALTVIAPLAFAAVGFRNVRRSSEAMHAALGEAELAVAQDILRAKGTVDAAELGRLMALPVDRAESLLAQAQVETFLDAGPEAGVRLRVEDEPPVEAETQAPSSRERVR